MKQPAKILFVSSAHDYRQGRKANMHFLAEALSADDNVRFASVGYSWLTTLKSHNPRKRVENRANLAETVNGIECYLWRSMLHPVNLRKEWLAPFSRAALSVFVRSTPPILRDWFRDSDVIVFECGLCAALARVAAQENPAARIIYNASDSLETIGADPILMDDLEELAGAFHAARIPSMELAEELSFFRDLRFLPHAVDERVTQYPGDSPYSDGHNVVSAGSMLFDAGAVEIFANQFPDVTFHMIGTGVRERTQLPNLIWYDEMPFEETLRYLWHADASIAPYRDENAPRYLKDTSMKLLQSDQMGIASVCPDFATDETKVLRFGYDRQDLESMKNAMKRALETPRQPATTRRSWRDVAEAMIA